MADTGPARWRRSAVLPTLVGPPLGRSPAWYRTTRGLALLATALGGLCAIYLSLRSTGRLATVPWLPGWAVEWADEHGRLRNLPAYALLTVPVLLLGSGRRSRTWGAVAVGAFGTFLELAEVFVPARMVEWQDIAWSWAGVAAAWLAFEGAARLSRPERAKRFRGSPV